MKGFNFEKNLLHQTQAVNSTVAVFDNLEIKSIKGVDRQFINNILDKNNGFFYSQNIGSIQEKTALKEESKVKAIS